MYRLSRFVVDFGGLVSYSPDLVAIWKRAAYYVDRILKGRSPTISRSSSPRNSNCCSTRCREAIGFAVPQSFRMRVTRVIEP
jgi:putative ABC transport system substrate-binding protein